MNRRRGTILVLVLFSLALAAALIVPLSRTSATESLIAERQAAGLRHRLAAESVLAILPDLFTQERRLNEDLDRGNRATMAFDVGDLSVEVELQDESAKLPARLVDGIGAGRLPQGLSDLGARLGLPHLSPRWTPVAFGCLDDLFESPDDMDLFGSAGLAWAQYVTVVGQAVQYKRADPVVLGILLADLDRDLGSKLARARRRGDTRSVQEVLGSLDLAGRVAESAARRLTDQTQAYSLRIRTRLADDVRNRYIVCSSGPDPAVLVDWEIAP